jgi:hypothetical protein
MRKESCACEATGPSYPSHAKVTVTLFTMLDTHTHTHNRYRYHPHHAPIGLSSAALAVARHLVLASLSLLFIVFARLLAVLVVGLLAWRRCCRRVA